MPRPTGSLIRQNIIDMLLVAKKGYGYEIYGWYLDIFPKAHQRSIYYHLQKGVETKELQVHKVKTVKGDYSWGGESQRIYYTLGKEAKPNTKKRIIKYFSTLTAKANLPSSS